MSVAAPAISLAAIIVAAVIGAVVYLIVRKRNRTKKESASGSKLLHNEPEYEENVDSDDPIFWRKQAGMAMMENKDELAHHFIIKSLARDDKDVHALFLAGMIYIKLSQFDNATTVCLQALDIDPESVRALVCLGDAKCGQGLYQEAISYYDKALSIKSDEDGAMLGKALSLSNIGRLDDATVLVEQVLRSGRGGHVNQAQRLKQRIACVRSR